ncbi:MAG: serine/threonine protein kinase [Pyrinomonadaceae bacterium]|nr:serine/threonine protein kinase [Pyrinomonadaceae bacterium]
MQNRYEISRLLKTGSMGAVYVALDHRLHNSVAVKELRNDDDFSASDCEVLSHAFKQEAQLLANLRHTAIPTVLDYFSENGNQYLVMELVPGIDLAELLRRQKVLPEISQVFDWANQLLEVLEYLHNQKIPVIHRDIKPSNIKLMQSGAIKLLDFGIAKSALMTEIQQPAEMSLRMATLEYAPLEQAMKASSQWRTALYAVNPTRVQEFSHSRTDARTDLFSLSATCYRLLTGELPVDSQIRALAIWTGKPDPLVPIRALREGIPTAFADSIMQCLALEPTARFDSAFQMRKRLNQAESCDLAAMPSQISPSNQFIQNRYSFEELIMQFAEIRQRINFLNFETNEAKELVEIERQKRESLEIKLREATRREKAEAQHRRALEAKWLNMESQLNQLEMKN